MPSNFMLGLGGFAQGFPKGLEAGTEQAQRQQQIEQQRLLLTLKGLEYLEKLPYVPDALQGPYTKSLSDWFEKATGKPIDPNVLSGIKNMAKEEGQTLSDIIPGIKEMVRTNQIKPEQVFAILGRGLSPESLLTIAKMHQTAQERKTLAELFAEKPGAFPVQGMPGGAPSQGPQATPTPSGGMAPTSRVQGAAIELATVNQAIQGLEQRLNLARGKVSDPVSLKPYEARLDDLTKRRRELEGYVQARPFAPNLLQLDMVREAHRLGKPYQVGGAIDPEVADAAAKRWEKRQQMLMAPKGIEGFRARRIYEMTIDAGGSEEEALMNFDRASNDKAFALSFFRGAGTKTGGLEAEISPRGTFPAPPGAQGMPEAPPPGPRRPIVPGVGEGGAQAPSGKSLAQIKAEQTSISGQAGDVAKQIAKLQKTRAAIEEIDILSKPLITAKGAPDTWWQKAQLAGGRITNYDQLAKYYRERTEVFLGNLARTVGEQVGVLTDVDLDLMRRGAIPNESDSMAQRDMKITALKAAWNLNMQSERARLESGGILSDDAYANYRQKIEGQLAKIMEAERIGRMTGGGGTATDFFNKYGITPGRK